MNRPKKRIWPATASQAAAHFSSSPVLSLSATTRSRAASSAQVATGMSTAVPRGQLYTIHGMSTAP